MAGLIFLSALSINFYASHRLQARIGNDLAVRATIMQKALDHGMYERYRDIANLANMHFILNLEQASDRHLASLLDRMKTSYPLYSWIGIVQTDGTVKAATGDMLIGADVSSRGWFQEALDGPYVGDVHDAMLLAGLMGASELEPLRFIDVSPRSWPATARSLGCLARTCPRTGCATCVTRRNRSMISSRNAIS